MAPYSKQRQSHRLTRVESRDTSVSKLKTNHIDNYATKSMQKLFLKNSLTIPKKYIIICRMDKDYFLFLNRISFLPGYVFFDKTCHVTRGSHLYQRGGATHAQFGRRIAFDRISNKLAKAAIESHHIRIIHIYNS